MIGKYVQRYCDEDISLIENYEEAISSEEMYDCHHRKEEEGYMYKDLIEMNLYFQRPAEELIFLKAADHKSLHQKGKTVSAETKTKISAYQKSKIVSAETKTKMAAAQKGKRAGKHWYKDEISGKRIWY